MRTLSFGLVLSLRFQILANLLPQLIERFNFIAETLRPLIIDFRQFLDADRVYFHSVFNQFAGQALGAEILGIIDRKRLFVVGFRAG